jgi:hypothetical protein
MKSGGIWLAAAVMVCLGVTGAWAEEPPSNGAIWKRFTVYGGAQFIQADGEFKYVRQGSPDIGVDLDDLGLDDNQISPAFGAIMHFWDRRVTLRFDYFGYHDDANATADFEFDWNGDTIPVGAALDSNLDIDIYAVNLSYNFIRSDRARLGLGLGLHAADLDMGLTGTVNGVVVASGDAEVLAPLPNAYLTAAYAFTGQILVRGATGGFSLSYADWDGSMWFANVFLEYWPWKHVGFGAGYRYIGVDVDYEPGHKKETYDFKLPGPMLYLAVGF